MRLPFSVPGLVFFHLTAITNIEYDHGDSRFTFVNAVSGRQEASLVERIIEGPWNEGSKSQEGKEKETGLLRTKDNPMLARVCLSRCIWE